MSAQTLIQKMRQQRQLRVEVAPGKFITLLRPQDWDTLALRGLSILDLVRRFGVDWSGFTEADLLAGGGSEPVEWHIDVAVELLGDRVEWLKAIDDKVAEALKLRADQREAALGN